MNAKALAFLAALGLGGVALAAQKPGPMTLEAGKRYRMTVSVTPALSPSDALLIRNAFELAGFKTTETRNVMGVSRVEKTLITFDAPELPFTQTEIPGQPLASLSGFSPGGRTLIFESAKVLS